MKSLINRDADVNSASSPVAPTTPDATNVTPSTPTDAAAPVTPQSPIAADAAIQTPTVAAEQPSPTTPPVEQVPVTPVVNEVAPTTPTEMKSETPQPPVDIPATVELEQFDTPSPMNEPINFDAVVIKFQYDLQSLNQLDLFQAQRFCAVSTTKEYSFVVDANKVTVTETATGATKEIVLEYAKNLADVI